MTLKQDMTGSDIELVRLFTCGSVDDGKSTLIGRLFLDTDSVADDVLEQLEADSKAHGTTGDLLDPALLTDGLSAEREQGITIDVAYRYFSTNTRRFIIADSPGHEEYTRNMATAASTANVAIILVDARKGILEQTKRHAFIASLLGIRHVLIAVNKMDLVNYSEEVFVKIREEFEEFAVRLDTTDLHFVPVSALRGDNIATSSSSMPWYQGGTLLHLLETVHIASDRNYVDFRFPVQLVTRPDESYRGYAGTVVSGAVRPGDEVVVLPRHRVTRVKSIDTFEGNLDIAFAPQAVTLTFDDDVDIGRGDMITPVQNITHIDSQFDATLIWMDDETLEPGHEYVLKASTQSVVATVSDLRYAINVNTLHRESVSTLTKNTIGRVTMKTVKPLCFDSYRRNRTTGSFILIDRVTNRTVAAGLILDRKADPSTIKADDVRYPVFWLTGNSGAGKSTLAAAAQTFFNEELSLSHPLARKLIVLDGDEMRATISVEEDLSPEGRTRHNLRVARLAAHLRDQGFVVLVSVIAPFEDVRRELSAICDPQWIYVARDGLEASDRPYEKPLSPALTIDHDALSKQEASESLLSFMKARLG